MNNKVWVVEAGWDYDGSEIIGVFSNYEKAIEAEKVVREKKQDTIGRIVSNMM